MGTSGLSLFSPSEQCQQRLCNIRFSVGHHGVPNPCAVLGWPDTLSHTCEQGVQEHALHHSPSQMEPYLVPSRIISHVIRSLPRSGTELPSWFSGKVLTPNSWWWWKSPHQRDRSAGSLGTCVPVTLSRSKITSSGWSLQDPACWIQANRWCRPDDTPEMELREGSG